jgi:hypothetical protein
MPTRKPSPKPRVPPKRKAAKAKPANDGAVGNRHLHAAPPLPTAPAPTTRTAGQPPHDPTKVDRDTVSVMVAGGIAQVDIARARSISVGTLRKHYRQELATGATVLNTIAITEHVKQIRAGNFHAIKWWQQARMGWTERIVVDDGKPADTPMRVVVEFVGEAATPRVDQSAPRTGSRLPDEIRKNVQLVG